MSDREVQIYSSKAELVAAVAERINKITQKSVKDSGRCAIALAGGNTPRDVYSLLSRDPYANQLNWHQIHLFWGDERMVPPDRPESNFKMVKEALLDRVAIPQQNIHRIRGEIDPADSASEYSRDLKKSFDARVPQFDLILLGLGEDGHTASLFPGTAAVEEEGKWAVSVFVSKLGSWRVTLTLPVLNNAKELIFIVSGKVKSQIVKKILELQGSVLEVPASLVSPSKGNVHWMLDSEAASLLE